MQVCSRFGQFSISLFWAQYGSIQMWTYGKSSLFWYSVGGLTKVTLRCNALLVRCIASIHGTNASDQKGIATKGDFRQASDSEGL